MRIDRENKTWELTSERMFDPSWERVYYTDIEEIFKAKPSGYHVEETRYPNGKFRSFTVSTN